jgi:hypothetical protein
MLCFKSKSLEGPGSYVALVSASDAALDAERDRQSSLPPFLIGDLPQLHNRQNNAQGPRPRLAFSWFNPGAVIDLDGRRCSIAQVQELTEQEIGLGSDYEWAVRAINCSLRAPETPWVASTCPR